MKKRNGTLLSILHLLAMLRAALLSNASRAPQPCGNSQQYLTMLSNAYAAQQSLIMAPPYNNEFQHAP